MENKERYHNATSKSRLKGTQTQPSSTQICGGSTLEMKLCTLISPQLAKKPLKNGDGQRQVKIGNHSALPLESPC
jgi:hypothetical protein